MNCVAEKTFRDGCCARFGCPAEAYELYVFTHCLYPQSRLLARLLSRLAPGFFFEDIEIIRQIGNLRDRAELNREVSNYFYHHRAGKGFLRGGLRVRLSRQRLRQLSLEVFS